jgi:hypothetical protein
MKISDFPNVCCVYFLLEDGVCVYVGSTYHLRERLNGHKLRDGVISGKFTVAWWEMSEEVARGMEAQFICALLPKFNKVIPRKSNHGACGWHPHDKSSIKVWIDYHNSLPKRYRYINV